MKVAPFVSFGMLEEARHFVHQTHLLLADYLLIESKLKARIKVAYVVKCVIKMVKKSRLTVSHSSIGSLISIRRVHGNLQKNTNSC